VERLSGYVQGSALVLTGTRRPAPQAHPHLVHSVGVWNRPLLLAGLTALAIVCLLALYGVRRLRARESEGVELELLPPDESQFDPGAWTTFFQSLFGIAHPWWKRWLIGDPWCTFEFRAQAGRVTASCWVPNRLRHLVSLHLRTALPGLEIRELGDG
jgi:hypothetical protein